MKLHDAKTGDRIRLYVDIGGHACPQSSQFVKSSIEAIVLEAGSGNLLVKKGDFCPKCTDQYIGEMCMIQGYNMDVELTFHHGEVVEIKSQEAQASKAEPAITIDITTKTPFTSIQELAGVVNEEVPSTPLSKIEPSKDTSNISLTPLALSLGTMLGAFLSLCEAKTEARVAITDEAMTEEVEDGTITQNVGEVK